MNYKDIRDISFEFLPPEDFREGVHGELHFPNGFGVSVVSHTQSYGGRHGLFELAVLDSEGRLTYSTPITLDVLGWLDAHEVTQIMRKVQEL